MAGSLALMLMRGEAPPPLEVIPEFVSVGLFASSTGTPVVQMPKWYADGDIFLLLVESANQAIATPSGWTEVGNSPQFTGTAAAAGGVRLAVFYKVVSGVQSSLTLADSGDHTTAQIACFRRISNSSPINTTAGSVKSSATGTTFTMPAVTTTVANCLVALCIGNDRDLASTTNLSNFSNANLAGLAEILDRTFASGVGGGVGAAYGIKSTAGSTGTTTATHAAANTAAFVTVAMTPDNDYFSTNKVTGASGSVSDVRYGGSAANASITLNTDGSITTSGNSPSVNSSWLNNVGAGNGSAFWVRAQSLGNSGTTTGTMSTWLRLDSARSWGASTGGGDSSSQQSIRFQFSTSSSGSPIVGSSEFSVSAQSLSGVEP